MFLKNEGGAAGCSVDVNRNLLGLDELFKRSSNRLHGSESPNSTKRSANDSHRMNLKFLTFVACCVSLTAYGQQRPVYTDAEAGKHAGEEASVTGKVFTVSTSSKGTTFVNLGGRFPKQTFSAVVFARNEGAVGDLKQYEGKEVILSGRIEMSPDQRPQIVINTADQIKLAAAAPTPAPATTSAAPPTVQSQQPAVTMPVPSSPPSAALPLSKMNPTGTQGKISLAMNWNSPGQGGEMARKDLAKLFGAYGKASDSTAVDTTMEVYPGVRFLSPLAAAKKALHLDGLQSTKTKVSTPGLPQGSFNTYVFGGVFAGGYTRLHLVVDSADQVVSILLVDMNTGTRAPNGTDTTGYHTYNFITGGAKATNDLVIRHNVVTENTNAGVIVVDTLLIDTTDPEVNQTGRPSKGKSGTSSKPKTGKVLERSRWFVPVPLVNLILRSVVQ